MIEHFKFLKAHCKRHAENVHPGAVSTFHFRQGRALVSKEAYPGYDEFFADVAAAWRKAIRAFYDAGCRYLQLDDTAWAMICDPQGARGIEGARRRSRQAAGDLRARHQCRARRQAGRHGDHHAFLPRQFPLHLDRAGGYEFVAEQLLGNTNLDGYFLEYDSDRAGGFEPLRYFPKGNKQLVLGLVTSK